MRSDIGDGNQRELAPREGLSVDWKNDYKEVKKQSLW